MHPFGIRRRTEIHLPPPLCLGNEIFPQEAGAQLQTGKRKSNFEGQGAENGKCGESVKLLDFSKSIKSKPISFSPVHLLFLLPTQTQIKRRHLLILTGQISFPRFGAFVFPPNHGEATKRNDDTIKSIFSELGYTTYSVSPRYQLQLNHPVGGWVRDPVQNSTLFQFLVSLMCCGIPYP